MPTLFATFLAFLVQRVRTENMEILARIAEEDRAGLDHPTLQDFLQVAVNMIVVLPIELEDATSRTRAAHYLRSQRAATDSTSYADGKADIPSELAIAQHVLEQLQTRVVCRNLAWLQRMLDDFAVGREDTLQVFCMHGAQGIAILPHAQVHHLHLDAAPVAAASTPAISTTPSKSEPNRLGQAPLDQDQDQPNQLAHVRRIPRYTHPSHIHIRTTLRQVIARYEAAAPWKTIFDPRRIVYPFDADQYPRLATNLRRFWRAHARAVWERNFWVLLRPTSEAEAYRSRNQRQNCAARSFEALVLRPVYEELGAAFFVQLDAQPHRHRWWWYRAPLVHLTVLWKQRGRETCLQYIHSKATKRFPVASTSQRTMQMRWRPTRDYPLVSDSMWTANAQYADLVRDVKALKEAQRPRTRQHMRDHDAMCG